MMEPDNPYYFELNWEIANDSTKAADLLKRRIRSAIRSVGDNYYLLGPDLISDPEIQVFGATRFLNKQDTISTSTDKRWEIPGEPRNLILSSGRKINERQRFYEVWADGCAHVSSCSLQTIEAVIFTHACTVLNGIFHDGTTRDCHFVDRISGVADLCVKRKTPHIETVLTSRALVVGRSTSDSLNIHFKIEHDREANQESIVVPYPVEMVPVLRHEGYAADGARGMTRSAEGYSMTGFGGALVHAEEFRKPLREDTEAMGSGFFARINFNEKEETSCILWICS